MRDISIDTESLGVRWDAPVIAVGAQAFDRDTGKMGATFHMNVELSSAIKSGRLDPETLKWWMRQSDAARQVFQDGNGIERYHLATVLEQLTTWVRSIGSGVPRVYARGPQQDITWLERSYDMGAIGLKEGWHYQNVFDLRAIIDLAQIDESTIKFMGTAHNALAEATHQAKVVSAAYMKINVLLKGKPAAKPATKPDEEEL